MKRKFRIAGVMFLILAGAAGAVWAKDAAGGPKSMTFADMFIVGGWCMWPLALCSIATVFFVIRNGIMLRTKNLLRADLKPELEKLMAGRDPVSYTHLTLPTNREV